MRQTDTDPPRVPPRLPRGLARLFLRGDAAEVIVGDLDQEFVESLDAGTPVARARRHYWRQTLASIAAIRRGRKDDDFMDRTRGFHPLQGIGLDVRAVLRVLRRSPGYVVVAVLSLAIGIGANTAVFSVVRQLLVQPLPVDRPNELRIVYWTPNTNDPINISNLNSSAFHGPDGAWYRSNYSYPEFVAMREAARGRAAVCGFNLAPGLTVSIDGRPPVVANGMLVSGNFFATVRPPIALGRAITSDDDQPGAPGAAVISYGLWTRLLGNDPNVAGRTIRVNDAPLIIIGVTGAAYRGLSPGGFSADTDITVAFAQQPVVTRSWAEPGQSLFTAPAVNWVRAIARVPDTADGAVTDLLRSSLRTTLASGGLTAARAAASAPRLFPGARGLDSLRTSATQPLRILSAVVGVVLLIACINVAGLMLARGVARQRELVVRRALGAGRGRIMRQLLLESTILSAAGGLAGLLLALVTAPVLQSMLSSGLGTNGVSVKLDWPVLATAALLVCTAAIAAGLLPALRFSRQTDSMLKDRSNGAAAPKLMIGRALLALQIAVSLPLVVGAGSFLRTIHNFDTVNLGFNPRGLVLFTADPTLNGRAPERSATVLPRLLARLETVPGVTSATLIENTLISGWESDSRITLDGREGVIYINAVGPHYLETMEIPLLAGRAIGPDDRSDLLPVAVINQSAAGKYFAGGSPVGRRFTIGKREIEVVGVSADTKYDALRNDVPPTILQSYLQRRIGSIHVAVRTEMPMAALRPLVESAVAEVDPTMPITGFASQQDVIDRSLGKERVFTNLLTVFGLFALLLACVGLHGVTSYSVARRTSEFGIRLALGAQRSQLLWLVLRQVVMLSIAGLAIGLPIAWLTGPAIRSLLFGLEPTDPLTIAASAVVMAAVAIGAGVWPARRAARMEALTALRSD